MRPSLRALALTALVAGFASLAGCSCSQTHVRDDAGMVGDGGCLGGTPLFCPLSCWSDAGAPPICVGGRWQCPPGSVDPSTCPPSCWGPPPRPDCSCDTTSATPSWVCPPTECPSGLDPWNPESAVNACSFEGASCASGSVCGAALSCVCMGSRWRCAVAEPDPACWCGREPAEGSPCSEEGASCGACCPTPGVPAYGPFTCLDGHWRGLDCPAIECPPLACPAERPIGGRCDTPGQTCGNACCDAQTCGPDGTWMPGPLADCDCDPASLYACGAGTCTSDTSCTSYCGPTDGLEHRCDPLPGTCASCDCLALPPGQSCTMLDGHVFVRESMFCG
ncbi:MAG: hypothetical protein K1X94_15885 [Sandaracinaceae bacterium]|nr:hypothetical protein [Sandaracinaceae bacterium]